jgi:hypothetical protein
MNCKVKIKEKLTWFDCDKHFSLTKFYLASINFQDRIRLPHTKVSPEIQSPSYFTSEEITLQEFPKGVRSSTFSKIITNR